MSFTTQNKRRPGAYINFQSDSTAPVLSNSNGVPALMVEKKWGPDDLFITVGSGTQFKALVGKDIADVPAIREALKGAGQVLVYLPAYAGATKAEIGTDFKVTAKYAGSLGNSINVVVKKQTDDSFVIRTIFDNRTVDEQTVTTALPQSNDYVKFSGTLPSDDVTLTLAGGEDGELNNDATAKFLQGLENQEFTHIAVGSDDTATKALALAKVRELRELGFGTNKSDAAYMLGQVDKIAKALVLAVCGVVKADEPKTEIQPKPIFERGEAVKLKDTATHWINRYSAVGATGQGRVPITNIEKAQTYTVTYQYGDGTFEVAILKNGKSEPGRYKAYERDFVKTEIKLTLHKVQVGAYADRANAEKMAKELTDKGFDTVIVEG